MTLTADFDAQLTQSEQSLISKARQFAHDYLRQGTDSLHTDDRRKLLQRASRLGLAGIEVPAEYGGAGASFAVRMRVCEELARHDAAFAFSLVNHHNVASRISLAATDSAREELLGNMLDGHIFGCTAMSEPQSGSDFVAMQTHASKVDGGWVINGQKAWITNANFADVFLVYAQTNPDAGAKGIAGFLVRASDAGFTRLPSDDAPSIRAMEVGGFALESCFVPDDRVLYPSPNGFMAAMKGVNQARIHVAAMNAGMIDQALQTALEYGESRHAFGKPVLDYQGLGWSLATVATHLTALRMLLYTATGDFDAGRDVQSLAAMAKKYANEHALTAISQCMQAMGAAGLRDEYPLMRHLNCARAFCYTDGTPEMMNERITYLMRKPYKNKS